MAAVPSLIDVGFDGGDGIPLSYKGSFCSNVVKIYAFELEKIKLTGLMGLDEKRKATPKLQFFRTGRDRPDKNMKSWLMTRDFLL